MKNIKDSFFERHIEKIVLALTAAVCGWLLVTRVFVSPNYVEYGQKKLAAGEIDSYISKQAQGLRTSLNRRPEPVQPYASRIDEYLATVDSSISDVDLQVYPYMPRPVSDAMAAQRQYRVPSINGLTDISAEHIRAVAYVPTEEINMERAYSVAEREPNDLDVVTVEGSFDVVQLYAAFNESFSGERIPKEWRDPCLAEPVFATVQLQRQELLGRNDNGQTFSMDVDKDVWSQWQDVPRTKIDHRKEMFEVVEDVRNLPAGGIKVRLLQFDNSEIRKDLLQPPSYQIASAREEWFPPSLHREYVKYLQDVKLQEKRQAREKEKKQQEGQLSRRRSRTRAPASQMSLEEFALSPLSTNPLSSSSSSRASARRTRKTRQRDRTRKRPVIKKKKSKNVTDFYDELKQLVIDKKTDFGQLSEPLIVWMHDDSVEPGKCYRYRMRLGVFNPIAGTDNFSDSDKKFKNNVILWSRFSDFADPVTIPQRTYFFPLQVQEAAKIVTITVFKYVLGYWYSEDFTVKVGEIIGKVSPYETKDTETQKDVKVPEEIDYKTGAVLLDITPVSDWSGTGNLRARHYLDMLYSFDGRQILRMPIKSSYWPIELQTRFSQVTRAESESREPLRQWAAGVRLGSVGAEPTLEPGEELTDEEVFEIMMRGYEP